MKNDPEDGSAYVFHTTDGGLTYGQVAKLTASDSEGGDKFGEIVGIDGDTIVVSAGYKDGGEDCYQQSTPYGYQEIGTDCYQGAVYVFRTTDGWVTHTETKLTASDALAGDDFGRSVAIEGSTVVVGARGVSTNAGYSGGQGAVYVFSTSDGWNTYTENKLTASDAAFSDQFGWSVAIGGGGVVVAGTYGKEAAYVFRTSDGWNTHTGQADGRRRRGARI